MTDTVMSIDTLPEFLIKMIPTVKVRVKETGGMIQLMPIKEDTDCPLLGIAADCGFTVDDFLARKREEKVLEGE